jgi:hypothetical protein
MSWQKAAWLLAGDQVCLAIMAQTWSLSYVFYALKSIVATLTSVFLQRLRMGSWAYYNGFGWSPVLDNFHNYASIYNEAPSDQGYL